MFVSLRYDGQNHARLLSLFGQTTVLGKYNSTDTLLSFTVFPSRLLSSKILILRKNLIYEQDNFDSEMAVYKRKVRAMYSMSQIS